MSIRPPEQGFIQNIGDATAGVATLGVLTEVVPVVVGVLGVGWFVLRFVNFYRVNYMNKEPWKGV